MATTDLANTSANKCQSRVALLLRQLKKYKRVPTGFMDLWKEVSQPTPAEEISTAKLFLEGGEFVAWFAYFLTCTAANCRYHFSGKAACKHLIVNLENEPAASRKQLAAQVANAIEKKLKEKVNRLYNKRIKPSQNDDMLQHLNQAPREYSFKSLDIVPYTV